MAMTPTAADEKRVVLTISCLSGDAFVGRNIVGLRCLAVEFRVRKGKRVTRRVHDHVASP